MVRAMRPGVVAVVGTRVLPLFRCVDKSCDDLLWPGVSGAAVTPLPPLPLPLPDAGPLLAIAVAVGETSGSGSGGGDDLTPPGAPLPLRSLGRASDMYEVLLISKPSGRRDS